MSLHHAHAMVKFSPRPDASCENCFCQCLLADDDFNRASIGSDWTVAAGTWSIVSNELQGSAANGQLIHVTTSTEHAIRARVKVDGQPRNARLIVGWTDANNYAFAEVSWPSSGTCGTLSLGEVVAGSTAILKSTPIRGLAVGGWCWWNLCFSSAYPSGYELTTQFNGAESLIAPTSVGGNRAGVGTGSGVPVLFDGVSIWKHMDTSANAQCYYCLGSCMIYSDPFDSRALDSCVWDVISGTWTYNPTYGDIDVASTNAAARCKVPNPLGDGSGHVQVSFYGTAGDIVRLFADADATMSQSIEMRATLSSKASANEYNQDGKLEILKNGSSLLSVTGLAIASDGIAMLCVSSSGEVAATVYGTGKYPSETITTTTTLNGNDFAAMGTGATVASAVSFRNFVYRRHKTSSGRDGGCPECEEPQGKCGTCCDQLTRPPGSIAVDINASHGNNQCNGCTGVTGRYVLDLVFGSGWGGWIPPEDGCGWQYVEKICTMSGFGLPSGCVDGYFNVQLWVDLVDHGSGPKCTWIVYAEIRSWLNSVDCYDSSWARYELEMTDSSNNDCQLESSLTLNKVSEYLGTSDPMCSPWSWPSSITIQKA